jgi:hypothetical protein
MNPFDILDNVRADYRTYVQTFQKFQNPCISGLSLPMPTC